MSNIGREELKIIHDKFVADPDWHLVEELIMQFIEPLRQVDSIETHGKSADEVFAQLQGQKTAYDALANFLRETKLVQEAVKTEQPKFN